MFGAYRTVLAVLVVLNHIAGAHKLGWHAVFGFYILSGYLMTLIMNRNYGYSLAGTWKYFINRFLRIFPIYWVACLLSLLLIYLLGDAYTTRFDVNLYVPHDAVSIFRNIFLFESDIIRPKMVPPSWALTIEIFFYICIGLGLSRNRTLTLTWFLVSVGYTAIANFADVSWQYKYFSIWGASLPFATGAMIFHYRAKLAELHSRYLGWSWIPLVYLSLIIANWAASYRFGLKYEFPFYVNFVLCAAMLPALLNRSFFHLLSQTQDEIIGDLSYPIYLIHYQVGLAVMAIADSLGFNIPRPSPMLALVSLPAIFLVAWLITVVLEHPIELLRQSVKAYSK